VQASVLTGQAKPDRLDDVIGFCQSSILQAMQEQTGCQGVILLSNHSTRQFMVISLWENRASLLAAEAGAYLQAQLRQVWVLLERPFITEHYVVNTSETDILLQS